MLKYLRRIVAILLVPSLIVDPAMASIRSVALHSSNALENNTVGLNEAALAPLALAENRSTMVPDRPVEISFFRSLARFRRAPPWRRSALASVLALTLTIPLLPGFTPVPPPQRTRPRLTVPRPEEFRPPSAAQGKRIEDATELAKKYMPGFEPMILNPRVHLNFLFTVDLDKSLRTMAQDPRNNIDLRDSIQRLRDLRSRGVPVDGGFTLIGFSNDGSMGTAVTVLQSNRAQTPAAVRTLVVHQMAHVLSVYRRPIDATVGPYYLPGSIEDEVEAYELANETLKAATIDPAAAPTTVQDLLGPNGIRRERQLLVQWKKLLPPQKPPTAAPPGAPPKPPKSTKESA